MIAVLTLLTMTDHDDDALREVNARGGVVDGSAGWQISNYQFHHHQGGEVGM